MLHSAAVKVQLQQALSTQQLLWQFVTRTMLQACQN